MNFNERFLKLQFSKQVQVNLFNQLHYLVEAGVPAPDALRYMFVAYKKKKNSLYTLVLGKMCDNAAEGRRIADGLNTWLPYEVCEILQVTEQRGILAEGLKNSIDYLQSNQKFFAPLGKMTVGVFYIITVSIAMAIIGHTLLPQVGALVKGTWPPLAQNLYNVGTFLFFYWWLVILAIIGLFIWIISSTRNYAGKFYQVIALPFMPIYKARLVYSLLQIFALLSHNGVGMPEVINILRKQHRKGFLADNLAAMHTRIRAGEQNMGETLDTGLFTEEQISELQLISRFVGEERYAEIFLVMTNIISNKIVRLFNRIAVISNAICLFSTAMVIVWIYAGFMLLASYVN